MNAIASGLKQAVRERPWVWGGTLTGFVVVYYLGLLATMLVRFGNIPNYVTVYNWPRNVWHILTSTPSLSDAVGIVSEEWLLEIGYMNYDYGNGISEWAMNVIPPKLFIILIVAALVASFVVLLMRPKKSACAAGPRTNAVAASVSGGAALVGLSSATLSWVVCCATPTWVVSLAMMGMSTSLALWLEPLGDVMTVGGFLLLVIPVCLLARRRTVPAGDGSATFSTQTA
ncbi:MAG: hypothetical protein WD767_05145 [Alphaproteobacteria bacterium]